jgi:ATP-dependent helicase YprA (DUF1998 family)
VKNSLAAWPLERKIPEIERVKSKLCSLMQMAFDPELPLHGYYVIHCHTKERLQVPHARKMRKRATRLLGDGGHAVLLVEHSHDARLRNELHQRFRLGRVENLATV